MRIPTEVIYKHLASFFSYQAVRINDGLMVTEILCGIPDKVSPGQIHLVSDQTDPKAFSHLHGSAIFFVGEYPPLTVSEDSDLLIFPSETNQAQLLNEVLSLFTTFQAWKDQLYECEHSFAGIKKMMELSHHFMQGSLILTDPSFHYLYFTADFVQFNVFMDSSEPDRSSPEIIRLLLEDPYFLKSTRNSEPFLFPEYEYPYPALCKSLLGRNGLAGILMFMKPALMYDSKDAILLEILGRRILSILDSVSPYSFPLNAYQNVRRILKGALNGGPLDEEHAAASLQQVGWAPDDELSVILFQPSPDLTGKEISGFLDQYLENSWPRSFCIRQGTDIYLIINRRLTSGRMDDELLDRICRTYQVIAGVSLNVSMEDLASAAHMANSACSTGLSGPNAGPVFKFQDVRLTYLIQFGRSNLSTKYLEHPAIRKLREYDQKNNTVHIDTLRVFLNENCNATHSAKLLFIHRSTLIERIDRIKGLTSLTGFTDPEIRLHLMLSLFGSE